MVSRDEVDGFKLDMWKVEAFIKQLVLWFSILIMTVLLLSLVMIDILNFFAPPSKDASDRLIDKLLNALNSEYIAGLVAERDSGRY